jgi:tripartite-type tricarboxylate transporter receptor subunit TctC
MPYDPIRDFTPVTLVAQVPNVLVMNAEAAQRLGITTVADLVGYAKKNPGKLNYGSGGNGSAGHLAGEMFKAQAGVFMVHIPYAGGNPAQLALLSGQVDLNFDNLAAASANIKSGKLRAIAVTTKARSSAMPEVPTIAAGGASLGLAQFDVSTWFGLFGPARLPADVLAKLNKAYTDALASPELKARMAMLMAEPAPTTPEQFSAFVKAELARYEPVVKASGAKVD